MIQPSEISVVIQGAISRETILLTRSVRKYLPGAEIVISTWENSDLTDLQYDIVLLNEDPGAISASTDENRKFNLNRQIVSSVNGVNATTRPYILKCRSDMELLGSGFLSYWDMYPSRESKYSFAKHKMLIPSLYTIKGETANGMLHPTPFHISDWYVFGMREDVLELVSPPLVDDEFSKYFCIHPKPRDYSILWLNERYWRYSPEQYFGVMYAQKYLKDLDFPNALAFDNVDFEVAERFLVNNFIVIEPADFQLVLNKGPYYNMSRNLNYCPQHIKNTIYCRYVYELDYQKYCDPHFAIDANTQKQSSDFSNYCDNIVSLCEKCKETPERKEYDFGIITPTYRGHFHFIEKYLRSFDRYVVDKQYVPIYFIIERAEFFDFCGIVSPYMDRIPIHVLILEDVLLHFGIKQKPAKLLQKYGRFTFQTLKKMYSMLYLDKSYYLVLDSESTWIQPTTMKNEFETFFKAPFIPYSPMSIQKPNVLATFAVENINHIFGEYTGKWFLECFSWYYDAKILRDLFDKYGSLIDMAEQVYQKDQKHDRVVGIFEILLYTIFIELNQDKYNYELIDIHEEVRKCLPPDEFLTYNDRVNRIYNSECGFAEHMTVNLNRENWEVLANLYRSKQFNIIRCETFDKETYRWQRKFLNHAQTKILAASQDHWFVEPVSTLKALKLEYFGLESKKDFIKRLMKSLLPAYRVSSDIRNKLEILDHEMRVSFDRTRWDNIWNQSCTVSHKESASLDLIHQQKLDVTDWIVEVMGKQWFSGRKLLIVDSSYGDWALPFLSLGAKIDFLAVRVESRNIIKRRYPQSRVYSSIGELKDSQFYDLFLNFNPVPYEEEQPLKSIDCCSYYFEVREVASKEQVARTKRSVKNESLNYQVIDEIRFGFCPMTPDKPLIEHDFSILCLAPEKFVKQNDEKR